MARPVTNKNTDTMTSGSQKKRARTVMEKSDTQSSITTSNVVAAQGELKRGLASKALLGYVKISLSSSNPTLKFGEWNPRKLNKPGLASMTAEFKSGACKPWTAPLVMIVDKGELSTEQTYLSAEAWVGASDDLLGRLPSLIPTNGAQYKVAAGQHRVVAAKAALEYFKKSLEKARKDSVEKKDALDNVPAGAVSQAEDLEKALKILENEIEILLKWEATVSVWPVQVYSNDALCSIAKENSLSPSDLHHFISQNIHHTFNKASIVEKLWDIFRLFRNGGEDAKAATGLIESAGNKIRDCTKNPKAKELAIKALCVSEGFIGTPILDCHSIHRGLKSPETGVYHTFIHSMINNLITILAPVPFSKTLSDAKAFVADIAQTKDLTEQFNEQISTYLSSGYQKFEEFQAVPVNSEELDELTETWETWKNEFLQKTLFVVSQLENHYDSFVPTWTQENYKLYQVEIEANGQSLPGYGENLLCRLDLEDLDSVFVSTYPDSTSILSTSKAAVLEAEEYRDKVVEKLQELSLRYRDDDNQALSNSWSFAAIRAYILLSPLPWKPIPLPLPTLSAQKKLHSELQPYASIIGMVSWYFEPLQSFISTSTSTTKVSNPSHQISSVISGMAYHGGSPPNYDQAIINGLTKIWLSLLTSEAMELDTLTEIFTLHPIAPLPPKSLKTKWEKSDVYQTCKKAFNKLVPQHKAPDQEEFAISVASSSSFRSSSQSRDFSSPAACLAEATSGDIFLSLNQQYTYTAVRKLRHHLALTIPLYASALFSDLPETMPTWKFWDQIDRKNGLAKGRTLREPDDDHRITKEVSDQSQKLEDLYNSLLHHPLLSFQLKEGTQVPDPVLGDLIHKLISVAGTRLDAIRLEEMSKANMGSISNEPEKVKIPTQQIFPLWKYSELVGKELPVLDEKEQQLRKKAGMEQAKQAAQAQKFSIYFPEEPTDYGGERFIGTPSSTQEADLGTLDSSPIQMANPHLLPSASDSSPANSPNLPPQSPLDFEIASLAGIEGLDLDASDEDLGLDASDDDLQPGDEQSPSRQHKNKKRKLN